MQILLASIERIEQYVPSDTALKFLGYSLGTIWHRSRTRLIIAKK